MQSVTNKRLDIDKALITVKETIQVGMCATVNFIIGFPEETTYTLNKSLDIMLRLRLLGARIYHTILSPHEGRESRARVAGQCGAGPSRLKA